MKPLFQLIKALDKGEKRYIKIYSSRHIIMGNSNDMELFDAISSLDEPSDRELKKIISNPTLVRNLSLYKHILYKNLLKCLNSYHTGKNVEDEILELYKSSRVLYDKSLYADAKRQISKARQLAEDNEVFGLYMFLREAESQIHERQFDLNEYREVLLDKSKDDGKVVQKLNSYFKLRSVSNEIYFHSRIWGVFDNELIRHHAPEKALKEFASLRTKLDSDKANLLAWKVLSLIDSINKDYKSSNNYEHKILQTLERKAEDYPGRTEEILVTLYRISANYYVMGEFDKLREIMNRIQAIPDSNNSIRLIKFQLFINYELLYKINFNVGETVEQLEKKILDAYSLNRDALGAQRMLIINYNMAILCFIEQNYEKCRHWLSMVLENSNRNIDIDLIISARLINVVLEYELGLYSLIKYSTLSAKRYIRKRRPLKESELLLFNLMNKLSSTKTKERASVLIKNFNNSITELKSSGKSSSDGFGFDFWAKSKVENAPIRKYLPKK